MMNGIDISHHNKWQYERKMIEFTKHDFIIMKATEGRTFVDPMLDKYMEVITELNKPYGFYHFARPENNSPIVEADNFCNTIGKDGDNAMLVLDWEASALRCDIMWALDWLKEVESVFGHKPLIYCSSWYTKKLGPILENGNGLWVAHYTHQKRPIIHTYPFWSIWQYTSDPYDKDIFNGNIAQWNRYIEHK